MKTDTAHEHWNTQWADIAEGSKWLTPEPDVIRWAGGLTPGAAILDLGAGVGRHARALAAQGFAVTALDAAPDGLAAIDAAGAGVNTVLAPMDALPFADGAFDHVLSWNVIYHGDEAVLTRTIAEIARVLKPGGSFLGTMLSKRNGHFGKGREISTDTFIYDHDGSGDEAHPHYYCNAQELVALFDGFELMELRDVDHSHRRPEHWHWHLVAEWLP